MAGAQRGGGEWEVSWDKNGDQDDQDVEDLVGLAEAPGVSVISKAGLGCTRARKTPAAFPPFLDFDMWHQRKVLSREGGT